MIRRSSIVGATGSTPACKGTMLLFGGLGGYIQALFPTQLYLRNAGFDVIAFEGPGQGAVLEEERRTNAISGQIG